MRLLCPTCGCTVSPGQIAGHGLQQRDRMRQALERIVAWDKAEKPHRNLPLLDCADLARKALEGEAIQ